MLCLLFTIGTKLNFKPIFSPRLHFRTVWSWKFDLDLNLICNLRLLHQKCLHVPAAPRQSTPFWCQLGNQTQTQPLSGLQGWWMALLCETWKREGSGIMEADRQSGGNAWRVWEGPLVTGRALSPSFLDKERKTIETGDGEGSSWQPPWGSGGTSCKGKETLLVLPCKGAQPISSGTRTHVPWESCTWEERQRSPCKLRGIYPEALSNSQLFFCFLASM